MSKRPMRYILAGLGGLAVGLGVTALLREAAGLSVDLSFAVALAVVFLFHFAANAFFVFRSGADWRILARYAVAALAFRGLDFLLFKVVLDFAPLHYLVAITLAILISNCIKYLVYANSVFVKRGDSPPPSTS